MPEEFAAHPERMARFEREAKSLAKLNHPNIAAIHGFDQHEGKWFLVLELVDGETLEERINKSPLDLQESLRVFQQIAEALEAAHDKEIVHRDLKPANIKIDSQGRVKVLDFGLAKARIERTATADSDTTAADSMAPTITNEFTMPGKVMGTAAYMSPEQSRGQEVDKRTDVWAFGCCLYEALTGRRPFKGQTSSDLLAEILKTDPDWTTLPPETPRDVVTLLRRCLEKETRRRLRDIGDIAITLEESSKMSRLESRTTTTATATVTAPVPNDSREPGATKKILQTMGSVVLALGFAYAVFDLAVGVDRNPAGESNQTVESIRSVAVLKIEPIGGDADLAVVANGLESDIRSQLTRIDGLGRHPAPRTVEKLAESDKLDSEIAGELGVDGLVYGRINRDGDEIELNVSLVYGPTATTLWETNFTSANPKALEAQAVLSLLEQFEVPLTDAEKSFLARADDVSIEAYTEYRKGIDALDVIGFANADDVIAHFESAIDKDSGFLPPYLHQAWALWWPTIYGAESMDSDQAFEKAFGVLAVAEEEFPGESIVPVTRDFFRMVSDFDFKTAKSTLEKALLESPNDLDLIFMNLWYRVLIESRYPDAMRLVNAALEQDPDRIAFIDAKAEIYSFMDDERKALDLNTGIASDNAEDFDRLVNNAFSYKHLGEEERALQSATEAVRVSGNHPAATAVQAEIKAAMGETQEAKRLLQEVEAKREAGHGISYNWNARVEAQLGDTKAAARSLRIAYETRQGWSFLYSMRNTHFTRLMADEPAFWELVDEMGYPPFPITHPLYELEQEKRYQRVVGGPATPMIRSLAVLPFENLKPAETTHSWISTAMRDEIRSRLGAIADLRLKTGYRTLSESTVTAYDEARSLGVDALVTGSYLVHNGHLQLRMFLVDSANGTEVALGQQEGMESEILNLQREAALAIASRIRNELTKEEQREISRARQVHPKAYAAYRRGQDLYWALSFDPAIEEFRNAISIDSSFVDPMVLLADAQWWPATLRKSELTSREAFERAKAQLAGAIELDPNHSGVLWQRGHIAMAGDWAWREARQLLREAIGKEGGHADFYEGFISFLIKVEGDYERAVEMLDKGLEIDPSSPALKYYVAHLHEEFGSWDLALRLHNEFNQLNPDDWDHMVGGATCLLMLDRPEEALSMAKQAVRISAGHVKAELLLASVYAYSGDRATALSLLEKVENQSGTVFISPTRVSLVHARLGDWDTTFRILEKALDQREDVWELFFLRTHEFLELMGDQSRYWDLVDRMKFPALPIQHPFYEKEQELRFGKNRAE